MFCEWINPSFRGLDEPERNLLAWMNPRRDETSRDNGANSRLKRNQRLSGSFHWSHKKRQNQRERERDGHTDRVVARGEGTGGNNFEVPHQTQPGNDVQLYQWVSTKCRLWTPQKTLSLSLSLGSLRCFTKYLSICRIQIQISVIVVPLDNYRFRCQQYNAL